MGNKVAGLEGTLLVTGRGEVTRVLWFTPLAKQNLWLSDDAGSQKFSSSVGKELNNKGEMVKLLQSVSWYDLVAMVVLSQRLYIMILEVFSNSYDSMSCPSAWSKKVKSKF